MKIIYKDNENRIMEEVEFSENEYFTKAFEFKPNYRTKEFHEHGILTRLVILKNDDENQAELVRQQIKNGIETSIGERKTIGTFMHEKLFHYDLNGNLTHISNEVFDEEKNAITSSFTYDFENEIPYWNGTSKYYYDKSIREDGALFESHYNEDGKLIPITIDIEELNLGDHDGTWIYDNEEGINDLIKIFKMSRSLAEFYVGSEIIPKIEVAKQNA